MSNDYEKIGSEGQQSTSVEKNPSDKIIDGLIINAVSKPRKRLKRIRNFILWLIFVLLILLGSLFALLRFGISGEFLSAKMQSSLTQQLGSFANIKITNAKLSLDDNYHLAIEAQNVSVEKIKSSGDVENIGTLKFGFSNYGLLRGRLQLEQVEFYNTNLFLPKSKDNNFLNTLPKDEFGRVDFDVMANEVFPILDETVANLNRLFIKTIILKNITIKLEDNAKQLNIKTLFLKNQKQIISIESLMEWENKPLTFMARANHDGMQEGRDLDLRIGSLPFHIGAADGLSPYLSNGRTNNGFFRLKGTTQFSMNARRHGPSGAPVVHVQLSMESGQMEVGVEKEIPTNFEINVEHQPQSGKLEVTPSYITIGNVNLPFDGAFGLMPLSEGQVKPSNDYRFEIVSKNASSIPVESPESVLNFGLKVAGQFNLENKKIDIQQITVAAPHGNLMGQGSLKFGKGLPETIFVLNVPEMNIAEAKQLWPINIAPGARRWVLSHIFGGKIKNGIIEIGLPLGFFQNGIPIAPLTAANVMVKADVADTRSDLVGDLPPLRHANGKVSIEGTTTHIKLDSGETYLSDNRTLYASKGSLLIPWGVQRPVYAVMNMNVSGNVKAAGEMISYQPINAQSKLPFDTNTALGDLDAEINIRFPITHDNPPGKVTYNADVNFKNFSSPKPINGILINAGSGNAKLTNHEVIIDAKGLVNDLPAELKMTQPFTNSQFKKQENIKLHLDDATRQKHFAFLDNFIKGPVVIDVSSEVNGYRKLTADLTQANLELPWVGWKKGKGIAATAKLDVPTDMGTRNEYKINNFIVSGNNINIQGTLDIKNKNLLAANFNKANLSNNDNVSLNISHTGKYYRIVVKGKSYDARSLIQVIGKKPLISANSTAQNDVIISANIDDVIGFNGENLYNVSASYESSGTKQTQTNIEAKTKSGMVVSVLSQNIKEQQKIRADSGDAGAILRFMNYYDKIEGGTLKANFNAQPSQPLSGPVGLRSFTVVNEPRLAKLVSTSPQSGGKSLNEKLKGRIDSSRVEFEVARAMISKGNNYLVLDQGVVRGPAVGATFQGVIYDGAGNTSMTGTFMPAYKLNRIFSVIPIIGDILGNGRDRGLIGITFKIDGNAKSPKVTVNPISAIAPGIFRSIFEFE